MDHYKLIHLQRVSQYSIQMLLTCISDVKFKQTNCFDTTYLIKKILSEVAKNPFLYPKISKIGCIGQSCDSSGEKACEKNLSCAQFMCANCDNMNFACCETCKLCIKCTLKNDSLNDWHQLFKRVKDMPNVNMSGTYCPILVLRLSIILLRIFRNFMSHLTDGKCQKIEEKEIKEYYPCPHFIPKFCKSWEDIHKTFKFAIEQVLRYLQNKKSITQEEMTFLQKHMKNVIEAKQHSAVFEESIMMEKINTIIGQNKEILSHVKKSIIIDVRFEFDKPTEFSLENSKDYDQGFRNGCEKYFKEKPDKYITNLKGNQPPICEKSFVITFKIKSDDMNLKDYEFYNNPNGRTRALCEKIKEELKKTLTKDVKSTLISTDLGSIIISVAINKKSNEEWNKDEIIEIEENMRQFSGGFKFTGDLSKCTITFKIQRPASRNTFSLAFQLNAFSEEMAACFDNIDEDKFKECLQKEMSRLNNENVTITGINE